MIKVINKKLHNENITIIDGKTYGVLENVNFERKILEQLTKSDDSPESIIKYHNFWKTYVFIK